MTLAALTASTAKAKDERAGSEWAEHLQTLIDPMWRPGEFDMNLLHFLPDPANPLTVAKMCSRPNCGRVMNNGQLCDDCAEEWKERNDDRLDFEEWKATPRAWKRTIQIGCSVDDCERSHFAQGLCHDHRGHYRYWARVNRDADPDVTSWIKETNPAPLAFRQMCIVPSCAQSQLNRSVLCVEHDRRQRRWASANGRDDWEVDAWIDHKQFEPRYEGSTYASLIGTPFFLLPTPLRWELLYASQTRDKNGRSAINPTELRQAYSRLRRLGTTSAVGLTMLGLRASDTNARGLYNELQLHIDDAHRAWSGIDDRDPRLIYLRDIELKATTHNPPGPRAVLDLRPLTQDWIAKTLAVWMRAAPRSRGDLYHSLQVWMTADEIIAARKTPRDALGLSDMDAIIRACRKRWTGEHTQASRIGSLARIIQFARLDEATADLWKDVPAGFAVNTVRHRAVGKPSRSSASGEAYRFVPQPIIDWMMDHLVAYGRSDEYATAEVRVMIFLQERVGRRTIETMRLKDDCVSYDNEGSPYLEWEQGKPPWAPGKRIPIHAETRDVIAAWKELKKKHGVKSEWLFPSRGHVAADRHYPAAFLSARVREFATFISEHHPFPGVAEGPDGMAIDFKIADVDAYSFRHAFAQRLADATDENGQSTTQPDVLRDLMGHKHFNTTMAYYQVSAKRRKRAMEAVPPRRLNSLGQVVTIDPERNDFTKLAVSLGHCTEPQNVVSGGHACALDNACESCPFFLVDPLERDGMQARLQHLKVKLERARVISAPSHVLGHYEGRIQDCQRIIDGIDRYVDGMNFSEGEIVRAALDEMADIRRRASAPRTIDIRKILTGEI
ncbi:MAG: hypothetical protein ACTHMF_19590 [Leifsonia sp.]|uniref:hypothetical protein n=1 Tax=Leifsonia sp. TaxID=1870902 RepID=UPI003F7F960E